MDSTKIVIANHCLDEGRPDCSVKTLSAKSSTIRETEFEC